MVRILGLILLIVIPLSALKDKEWQEGKLIDIKNEPYTEGSVFVSGGVHKERITYVIEAGTYIYSASHLHYRRDKTMPITVNAKVKFAIEKTKFYLLDEDGKEHDLKL